jgi:flagellar biosynthesis/type III secretory pathway protein FliH
VKSLSPEGEEISILHNGIIKESQLKVCSYNIHTFPAFGIDSNVKSDCSLENSFKRLNNRDINENKDNRNNCTPDDKLLQRIEEAEKTAFENGYKKGVLEGIANGKMEIEPVLNKFKKALDEIVSMRRNLSHMAEIEAVNLSMAVARKIVGNEISTNRNIIRNTIKEALKKVEGHEFIKIKVNPVELQIIEAAKAELKDIANCMQDIEVIGDDDISPGGCLIETNIGDIDARIEKQLKIVEDAFKIESRPALKE